jgi:hypothetical protein
MHKAGNFVTLFLLMCAVPLVVNSIGNPRLAALHGPDILRLIAIGLLFGVAIGVQSGARVFGAKAAQPQVKL